MVRFFTDSSLKMGKAKILTASAGAGKTYQLAYKYVSEIIACPEAYRNILAVTFTNKATEEMKNRILDHLNALAAGKKTPFMEDLLRDFGQFDAQTIRRRAKEARTRILHDYGRFTVLTIDKFFQRIPIVRDDVFFIKAGLIHSLCAGSLVVEIQESSNLTYRIYDYERVDRNGERRRLDIDKALAVADLLRQDPPRQPMRVIRYRPGYAEEFVGRCRYFEVHRFLMNLCDAAMPYSSDSLSFRVLLCIEGGLSVVFEGEVLELCKGQTLFVPADSCPMEINGNGQVLEIRG